MSRRSKVKREHSAELGPYQSLVAEYIAAEASSPARSTNDGPSSTKRRRLQGSSVGINSATATEDEAGLQTPPRQQFAYNDTEEDDATDEYTDADFEDVLPSGAHRAAPGPRPVGDLKLTLGGEDTESPRKLSASRRKALTAADRKLRLNIHKTHVLALLGHVRIRNRWCNDAQVQAAFRGLLPTSVRKMFKDDTTQTQWQRSRSLKMGLEKVVEIYKDVFQISARGMARSYWIDPDSDRQDDPVPEDIDLLVDKDDFCKLAATRKASRDIGAQLFCALLRSIGLDVRLVCSLQPLPIRAVNRPASLVRPAPVVVPFHDNRVGMAPESAESRLAASLKPGPNAVPQGVRRFGHAIKKASSIITKENKEKRIHESPFPVFWVEVFNMADQKWIPIDPLVLKLVDKPSKYEPPANDAENSMSYVVAIDEDGYMKDITRRYAHAYNAKTRRNRVESTKNGQEWWDRVTKFYRDPLPQDRDQVEDSELTAKEAREPMPKNIADFQNHPYYVLERHIRKNEVLQPKRQVGTVSSGNTKAVEAIYRRSDVHTVRSADNWFRRGQQVKFNEIPLKYLEQKKEQTKDNEDEEEEAEIPGVYAGAPLYAAYQTEPYIAPPVLNGMVPKNMYGNIDIYTTTMIPAGGVWINHPFAGGAAKLLAIDWADTVTGFEFRGRTGTAVVKGVVVAGEFHEAIVETIKSLRYAIEEEETSRRSLQVLQTWKRFLIALRIRQRVQSYHVEGEELEQANKQSNNDSESEYEATENDSDEDNAARDMGGGFLRGEHQDQSDIEPTIPAPQATPQAANQAANQAPSKALQDAKAPILSTWGEPLPPISLEVPPLAPISHAEFGYHGAGGFMPEGGGFLVEDSLMPIEHGGGFLPDDDGMQLVQHAPVSQIEEPQGSETDGLGDETGVGGGFEAMQVPEREPSAEEMPDAAAAPANEHGSTSVLAEEGFALPVHEQQATLTTSVPAPSEDIEVTDFAERRPSADSTNSLLSHDPEDDDAEPEWI